MGGLSTSLYNALVGVDNYYRLTVPFAKEKGRKLACSAFYNNLLAKMKAVYNGESTLKFAFYSGHDGSLISFLACLDNTPNEIPPFASTLFFELTDND
mmetsp:Transcript_12889/g.1963  ORF Transcript_12889/g.1963 Transcript_12889/m.1963 type:complete len:98 (-) Transcript_12889:169-462(-)